MIKFEVVIIEERGGRLRITAKTPPSGATAREIEMGIEFKGLVKDLALKHRAATDSDWAHPAKRYRRRKLMSLPRYTIAGDGKSITCNRCGRTSHHPVDVKEKFCGNCGIFHDDPDHVITDKRIADSRLANSQGEPPLTLGGLLLGLGEEEPIPGGAHGVTRPTTLESTLDSANHFSVVVTGAGKVSVSIPLLGVGGRHYRLVHFSKAEALNLAVWVKLMADPEGTEFARVEADVRKPVTANQR